MQYSVLDLLGSALVPVLGADVAAGTAGNVHLSLVRIAALGAFPNQLAVILLDLDLAVIAAALAVVGLAEDDSSYAYRMNLYYGYDNANLNRKNKNLGFSVRCVKD